MCACEPCFICSRCAGTPADPNYVDDEPRDPASLWDGYPEGVPAPDGWEPHA